MSGWTDSPLETRFMQKTCGSCVAGCKTRARDAAGLA